MGPRGDQWSSQHPGQKTAVVMCWWQAHLVAVLLDRHVDIQAMATVAIPRTGHTYLLELAVAARVAARPAGGSRRNSQCPER